jgi:RNA polymerase sigma-70 factor (ECF subfamily)
MRRICDSDVSALDELLRCYWSPIVHYAERMLGGTDAAEDIAQQVFIQLWQRRSEWHFTGSVQSYLYRVARNLALNEQRHQSMRQRWSDRVRLRGQRRPVQPDQEVEGRELRTAVDAAIAALPERRREVFILARFQGLSYREIAEVMGISTQTVANQLSAALADLRNELAGFLDDAPSVPLRLVRSKSSSKSESATHSDLDSQDDPRCE